MNITIKQIEFQSSNGVSSLFGWLYIPAGEVRATVQISHGMTEHMGRYHDFMRFLAQNGYAACGIDHLGHGRSANGQLGFFGEIDGWKYLVEDQYKFSKIIRTELSGTHRAVLLGHSMGSFIARLYAAKYPRAVDGLILSGTRRGGVSVDFAIRAAELSMRKNGARFVDHALHKLAFGHYNDRFAPVRIGSEWLSRDAELLRRNAEDPLCRFTFTAAGFRDLFTMVSRCNLQNCFDSLRKETPVLLISGLADPVGEYGKGPRQVYKRYVKAGVSDVEIRLYEGGRHEMLNETNRRQVWDELLAWLASHDTDVPDGDRT